VEPQVEEAGVEAGVVAREQEVAADGQVEARPTAAPLTAAMVGSGERRTRRNPS